jgi:hypothetical protein
MAVSWSAVSWSMGLFTIVALVMDLRLALLQ